MLYPRGKKNLYNRRKKEICIVREKNCISEREREKENSIIIEKRVGVKNEGIPFPREFFLEERRRKRKIEKEREKDEEVLLGNSDSNRNKNVIYFQ